MNEQVLSGVDEHALVEALDQAAPKLGAGSGLEAVGDGFYSFVFCTGLGWIVRVARTEAAAARHRRECVTLPIVAARVPISVPEPRVVLAGCGAAPFGAVAYRRVPGRMMAAADAEGESGARIAAQLGEALAALHAIEPSSFPPRTLPEPDPGHLERLWNTVSGDLERRLSEIEWRRVRDWWLEFRASGAAPPRKTVTHGDAWWQNLTVDESGLHGMLDWEYLSLSDPANDLGVTLEMGEDFFQHCLANYRERRQEPDPGLEARARQRFAARALYGFEFAIRRSDDEEWEDSLESLRAGPILRG